MVTKTEGRKAIKNVDEIVSKEKLYFEYLGERFVNRLDAIITKWGKERLGSSDKYDGILKDFSKALTDAYTSFIGTFTDALAAAFTPITNAFNKIYTGLTGAFGTVKTWLDTALGNITTGFSDMIKWSSDNFFKTWESLTVHMTEFSDWTYQGMMKSWNGVLGSFDNAGLRISNKLQGIFGLDSLGSFNFGKMLAAEFKKIFKFDKDFAQNMFETMSGTIKNYRDQNTAKILEDLYKD